jgi:hypothetical protein
LGRILDSGKDGQVWAIPHHAKQSDTAQIEECWGEKREWREGDGMSVVSPYEQQQEKSGGREVIMQEEMKKRGDRDYKG